MFKNFNGEYENKIKKIDANIEELEKKKRIFEEDAVKIRAELSELESGIAVDYRQTTAEDLAAERPGEFDVVTCLEMLEHVPEPYEVIRSCKTLVKPGGDVFFSTINRNPKSFLFAIVGAEYVLKLLPAGTHEYRKFIRPSELDAWAREAGLQLVSSIGLHYNPFTREYSLGSNLDVNYLMYFRRPESD